MTLTSDQVVAAITYLIPGFIALKILYVFGFRSKRSDIEWALWSLLASLALAPLITELGKAFGWISPATFVDAVKKCAGPVLTGPEADRLTGVVTCATAALSQQTQNVLMVGLGVLLGVVLGMTLVLIWIVLDRRWPWLGAKGIATAWDRRLDVEANAPWVEVTVENGRLQGILASAASDVETDKADLFLTMPAWINANNVAVPIQDVEGVWLPRSEVKSMVIIGPS
jgi:Family of unknown function (DUF6338)